MELVSNRVNAGTHLSYSGLRGVIPGNLWRMAVSEVNRPTLKAWVIGLIQAGYKRGTVKKQLGIMRTMLTEAVDDGVIRFNPAIGLGRTLGLVGGRAVQDVRAMDADQLQTFMAIAQVEEAPLFPAFALMGYAGLRSGEVRGLRFEDIDLEHGKIHVRRQVYLHGGVGLPKGGKQRSVDMSTHLGAILRGILPALLEYHLAKGRKSQWLLFPAFSPEPTGREVAAVVARTRLAMARVLRHAKLPGTFTPHCLRHTYASVQLSKGESLLYVARQLGDTLHMTADTYGRSAPVPPTSGGPNLLSPAKPEKKTAPKRWE